MVHFRPQITFAAHLPRAVFRPTDLFPRSKLISRRNAAAVLFPLGRFVCVCGIIAFLFVLITVVTYFLLLCYVFCIVCRGYMWYCIFYLYSIVYLIYVEYCMSYLYNIVYLVFIVLFAYSSLSFIFHISVSLINPLIHFLQSTAHRFRFLIRIMQGSLSTLVVDGFE